MLLRAEPPEDVRVTAFLKDLTRRLGLAGLAALAHGERAAAAEHFETALSLYRGDFLADEPYAEWALTERERLHELAEKPLRGLGELHGDDPDTAAGYLERLAQMEPLDGAVQRELLTLWLRQGRLSRATRHYQAFRVQNKPNIFRRTEARRFGHLSS